MINRNKIKNGNTFNQPSTALVNKNNNNINSKNKMRKKNKDARYQEKPQQANIDGIAAADIFVDNGEGEHERQLRSIVSVAALTSGSSSGKINNMTVLSL